MSIPKTLKYQFVLEPAELAVREGLIKADTTRMPCRLARPPEEAGRISSPGQASQRALKSSPFAADGSSMLQLAAASHLQTLGTLLLE